MVQNFISTHKISKLTALHCSTQPLQLCSKNKFWGKKKGIPWIHVLKLDVRIRLWRHGYKVTEFLVACVVTVKVMRERWKTWRSVCDSLPGTSCCQHDGVFFYGAEKQTASLSNYEYLAPVTLRQRSALYRLFLKGWSHTEGLIKMCIKCVFVSSV